jgi:hypothetical protein
MVWMAELHQRECGNGGLLSCVDSNVAKTIKPTIAFTDSVRIATSYINVCFTYSFHGFNLEHLIVHERAEKAMARYGRQKGYTWTTINGG